MVILITMTTLTKDKFTKTLTKALNHQPRFYSRIDILSFLYESDESNSEVEYENLQDILKALGSNKFSDLFQIKQGSRYPLWNVSEIYDKIRVLVSTEEVVVTPSLFWPKLAWGKTEPMLGPETSKAICLSRFISEITESLYLEGYEPIEILLVLDSYYSCLVTHAKPTERIAEVVAGLRQKILRLEKMHHNTSLSPLS